MDFGIKKIITLIKIGSIININIGLFLIANTINLNSDKIDTKFERLSKKLSFK